MAGQKTDVHMYMKRRGLVVYLKLAMHWLLLGVDLRLWHVATSALREQAAKVEVAEILHAWLLQQRAQHVGQGSHLLGDGLRLLVLLSGLLLPT